MKPEGGCVKYKDASTSTWVELKCEGGDGSGNYTSPSDDGKMPVCA